jgi:polar amino acid transport system substrate-binding protein
MQNGFKLEDLNSPKITITCRRGASSCANLAEYFPKACASEPLPTRTASENPGKLFIPLSQDQELNRLPAGMAIRKGDVDTLNVLNNWIEVNTKFFQQRRHYWFETQDWRSQVAKAN